MTSRTPPVRIGERFGENVSGLLIGFLPDEVVRRVLKTFMQPVYGYTMRAVQMSQLV